MSRNSVILWASALCLWITSSAGAAFVNVDGFLIPDGAPQDLNALPGIIEFDSTHATAGFSTVSGFDATGKVEIFFGSGAGITTNTAAVLRLTDMVVDAYASSAAVPGQFRIVFEHDFGSAIPGPANAADQIDDAFSHDGTGSPVFQNGAGAVLLVANEDFMFSWQGYIDSVPIPNPSGTPPFGNLAGLNQPYPLYGHADPLMFGGLVYDPTLRGDLTIELGGARNQFILNTSAEVAAVIPEPGTLALLGLGGVAMIRRRRTA